ncbi:MAG: hypothetical protein J6A36_03185 [Clostridia bacterium]|nr:hypothetical protein [Clostridia bacterium]
MENRNLGHIRRKTRKNRKIKFSEQDYFEKHYLKDGKAIIPISIEKIDDLYMKHDYLKLDLSDSLCNYIEEMAYIVPIEYDIVLEIHSPELSVEEQNRIRKNFKSNFGMEIDDIDYSIKEANKKATTLFVFGTIFLILSYLLYSHVWDFFYELVNIAGWVALWDMVEILILDNDESRIERLNKLQLYDANVTFIFDK